MTDQELKPCPFCGGDAHFERLGNNRSSTIVECEDCGARLEDGSTFNHHDSWNTRVIDKSKLDKLIALRDEISEALQNGSRSIWNMSAQKAYNKAIAIYEGE